MGRSSAWRYSEKKEADCCMIKRQHQLLKPAHERVAAIDPQVMAELTPAASPAFLQAGNDTPLARILGRLTRGSTSTAVEKLVGRSSSAEGGGKENSVGVALSNVGEEGQEESSMSGAGSGWIPWVKGDPAIDWGQESGG